MTSIERLLRQAASVRLAAELRRGQPVVLERLAEQVVASRLNLSAVAARRRALVHDIAAFLRELNAQDHAE